MTKHTAAEPSESNVIPDHATLQLNIRTYNEQTRTAMLDAIRRIVVAECQASDSPKEPDFELFDQFPLTDNDTAATTQVGDAFSAFFGDSHQPPAHRHWSSRGWPGWHHPHERYADASTLGLRLH